jgi:hypothetical protein
MPIVVLLYIIICYKINLPVYWYDWTLFAFLEIAAIGRFLYRKEMNEAWERGLAKGNREADRKEDLFSDVET